MRTISEDLSGVGWKPTNPITAFKGGMGSLGFQTEEESLDENAKMQESLTKSLRPYGPYAIRLS